MRGSLPGDEGKRHTRPDSGSKAPRQRASRHAGLGVGKVWCNIGDQMPVAQGPRGGEGSHGGSVSGSPGAPPALFNSSRDESFEQDSTSHFRPSGSQAGGLSLNPERSPPPPGTHRWDKLAPRALGGAGGWGVVGGGGASACAWKEEGGRSASCPSPTHALSPGT